MEDSIEQYLKQKNEKLALFPELQEIDEKYWIIIPKEILRLFVFLKMINNYKPKECTWHVKEYNYQELQTIRDDFHEAFDEWQQSIPAAGGNLNFQQNDEYIIASDNEDADKEVDYNPIQKTKYPKQFGYQFEQNRMFTFLNQQPQWKQKLYEISLIDFSSKEVINEEECWFHSMEDLQDYQNKYFNHIDESIAEKEGLDLIQTYKEIIEEAKEAFTVNSWEPRWIRRIQAFIIYSQNWKNEWPQKFQDLVECNQILEEFNKENPFQEISPASASPE